MDSSQFYTAIVGVVTSLITIFVGSNIDIIEEIDSGVNDPDNPSQSTVQHNVTLFQALSYPIYASISLLSLYLFFEYIQYVLVFFVVLSSAYSLYIVIFTFLQKIPNIPLILSNNAQNLLCMLLSILVCIEWIHNGNILCHDLLGCALCVLFISVLRFPSLKIATITLGLLLLYDIFWVFFSEYFFAKNVMVEVATKNASNPVQDVGKYLNIEILKKTTQTINLPIKLIFPNFWKPNSRSIILGLGDIALPGALVALARRSDVAFSTVSFHKRKEDIEAGTSGNVSCDTSFLFFSAMIGYLVGLFSAFLGSVLSNHPQPALIYIVPGVIIFLAGRAYSIGRLNDIWLGTYKSSEN